MTIIRELLELAVARNASDLHLTVGAPPMIRVSGALGPLDGFEPMNAATLQGIVESLLSDGNRQRFDQEGDVDFSFGIAGLGRFRVNAFQQRGSPALCLRTIPMHVPPLDTLGLPEILVDLCDLRQGLVLITGPTGSGKSTTLAAMVDHINRNRAAVIITIEDPIEYLHQHNKSIVNQREVGTDTVSFASSLRAALREDPDVIMVGEMRDVETMATALRAAETGHLVFSTLHTRGCANTVDRIVDSFPAHQQQQVRTQLADALQAVIWQQLVPRQEGGVVAACEVMVATSAIRNLIRDGRTFQIPATMETGARFGMQTMKKALEDLVIAGIVSEEVSEAYAH